MNQIQELADKFVRNLRESLTPEQFAEMCQKNSTPEYQGGVCASHDYVDANMVMLDAFEDVVGRRMVMDGGDSPIEQADRALWNAAWEYAHATKLRVQPVLEYEDSEGHRVTISSDDGATVEFYTSGGGFARKLARSRFFEIFKPAAAPTWRRGQVDGDWMENGETLPCWSDGSLWNGWSMPFFPREAVDKLIAQSEAESIYPMRWEGDTVVMYDEQDDEAVRVTPITMPDGLPAWPVGSGWWCWNSIQYEGENNDA
jgi:hypothetical protein